MSEEYLLNRVGYRIITKPWSAVKAIMAEFTPNVDLLKRAMKEGHGIEIDEGIPGADPMLHIIIDQEMVDKMREYKIVNPTILQLIGTSRCIGISKEDAINKFTAMVS